MGTPPCYGRGIAWKTAGNIGKTEKNHDGNRDIDSKYGDERVKGRSAANDDNEGKGRHSACHEKLNQNRMKHQNG